MGSLGRGLGGPCTWPLPTRAGPERTELLELAFDRVTGSGRDLKHYGHSACTTVRFLVLEGLSVPSTVDINPLQAWLHQPQVVVGNSFYQLGSRLNVTSESHLGLEHI